MQGCSPCRAVITDVVGTDNAAGFSGTNAQEVAIVNSEWTNNMSGIVPNTQDAEVGAPQRDLLIAGNYVHDNGNLAAPALALIYPSFGMGIVVAGGLDNLVTGNLIEDQRTYGIVVVPILDRNLWPTSVQRGPRQRRSPERARRSCVGSALLRRRLLLGQWIIDE